MMKIYISIPPEVQDFDDVEEAKTKTDKINKENMNEFLIFIAEEK